MDAKELLRTKESYETPELTVFGAVEELTQGAGGVSRVDATSGVEIA